MGLLQPTASSPWPVTRGPGPLCVCASVRLCVCTCVPQPRPVALSSARCRRGLLQPDQTCSARACPALLGSGPNGRPAGGSCPPLVTAAGPCLSRRVDADTPAMTGTRPARDSATVVVRVSTGLAARVVLQRGPSGVHDKESSYEAYGPGPGRGRDRPGPARCDHPARRGVGVGARGGPGSLVLPRQRGRTTCVRGPCGAPRPLPAGPRPCRRANGDAPAMTGTRLTPATTAPLGPRSPRTPPEARPSRGPRSGSGWT